jgi:two-component system sensor histidine kinase PilS (NtrC family)
VAGSQGATSWFKAEPKTAAASDMASAAPAGPSAGVWPWLDALWLDSLSVRSSGAGLALGRSLSRIFRTYLAARAVVGVVLAAMQLLASASGNTPKTAALLICSLYAVEALAAAVWLWGRDRIRPVSLGSRVWLALTVGVDLIAFLILLSHGSGFSLNHGSLLVLPVLMAGVLMSRPGALATAAFVTLVLLADAWLASAKAPAAPSPWLGLALAGMGFMVIAWVAGELSARLRREERLAVDSQEQAHRQAGLNRLVIQEMSEGVLVLDRHRRVLAVNPAAQALLGLHIAGQGAYEDAEGAVLPWSPLLRSVERAHVEGAWPAAGRTVPWPSGPGVSGSPKKLRVRLRFTRLETANRARARGPAGHARDLCMLLLDDERTIQARVQQEKLAAMGRVSAGIAHEIRNPLAAIAQANELLSEDRFGRSQERLRSIVSDNVVRLRRLAEDLLESMPTGAGQADAVAVVELVRTVVGEWSATAGADAGVVELNLLAHDGTAWFDPEHLRRILVNLLDNGFWHSSRGAGAVKLTVAPGVGDGVVVVVSNDGPPIAPEVEVHMFEPFFSTRSRGCGLGLYLCRELCERHGADIRHAQLPPQERHRTAFVVQLPGPSAAAEGWGSL